MTQTFYKMTYCERESLKVFARNNKNLRNTIVMIAHWMRQDHKINFSCYAANWAVAHQGKDVEAMALEWPLKGKRHIKDGGSDWHINPITS